MVDLKLIDDILSAYNENHTGEEIRASLAKRGYAVCLMAGGSHSGYCPTCGCEPANEFEQVQIKRAV